jgi:hypothetical protein
MAVPQQRSYQRILGEMLDSFLSKVGVNDLNRGSVIRSFMETVAQAIARENGNAMKALQAYDLDKAVADTLKKIARDEDVAIAPARVGSTVVTVTDTRYQKIASKIYAGSPPPTEGSTAIRVADADAFPSVGAIYIGRGTPNVEGPIGYSAVTQVGQYWELTLDTPTVKYHNMSETVVVAQGGNRAIGVGAVVRAPATGSSPAVSFSVTANAVLLDGEVSITGVQVASLEPAASANVPSMAIKEFASPPFDGAIVTNPSPVSNARDPMTNEEIREAIKKKRASKGLGTETAVRDGVLGARPEDEDVTIASSQVVRAPDRTTLYIDDGDMYEEKSDGVGVEPIVDAAVGNPKLFQLSFGGRQTSVVKASLTSSELDPFDVRPLDRLALLVGGVSSEHIFQEGDFRNPGAATAFEVVASINASASLLFKASTAASGRRVVIKARAEEREYLQRALVSEGRDAATALGLPSQEVRTLLLYKNGTQLLDGSGREATVDTSPQQDWSAAVQGGDTLILDVDRTGMRTYEIQDADFVEEGHYLRVARSNSLASWAEVLNRKIPGVTTAVVGGQLRLTSNRGLSSRASLEIDPTSTLVSKNMFSAAEGLASVGGAKDYSFSRNTGQIELAQALVSGESLSAGSERTRAEVAGGFILGGGVTLPNQADLWVLFDDPAALVIQDAAAGSEITTSKQGGNVVRYTSDRATAFLGVQPGDYVISAALDLDPSNRGEFRVLNVASDYIEARLTSAEYAAFNEGAQPAVVGGFHFLRSRLVPHKLSVPAGAYGLSALAALLSAQVFPHGEVLSEGDERLLVRSRTRSSTGRVLIVALAEGAEALDLSKGASGSSQTSLTAFEEAGSRPGSFPLFRHGLFDGEDSELPPASFITQVTLDQELSDPNDLLGLCQPFEESREAQAAGELLQIASLSSFDAQVRDSDLVKRVRVGDRWFLTRGLDLGADDLLVVVLDDDPSTKTFPVPLYRRVVANGSYPTSNLSFNAHDVDAGPAAELDDNFGAGFSFSDYKALMKAKNVVDGPNDRDALLFRSAQWGRSGELVDVAYVYPTAPNQTLSHVVTVSDRVRVRIALPSASAVPSDHDGTTEWSVTVQPHPDYAGAEVVTYAHTGTGTAPNLALSGGEYVRITSATELDPANQGSFRVSDLAGFAPTASAFSVERKAGSAVVESDKAVLSTDALGFYAAASTTAADVQAYVEANLSGWVTATIVDDNGTSGDGEILLATEDVLEFADTSVPLLDGLNYVASSDLGSSPQLELKIPLQLPTATGYAFNAGEEVRLVPTTAVHLEEFLSVLAVTGLTTLGGVAAVLRGSALEASTDTIGGSGAVLFAGGAGNSSAAVVSGEAVVRGEFLPIPIPKGASGGFFSGQVVRLEAANLQKKTSGIDASNGLVSEPVSGEDQTVVSVTERLATSRLFGDPRRHVRTHGFQFLVERHGDLVCLTYAGTNGDLGWQRDVEIDHDNSDSIEVEPHADGRHATIRSAAGSFVNADIEDVLTISGFANDANNGVFELLGVSDDGSELVVHNPDAVAETDTAITIAVRTEVGEGDTLEVREPFDVLNQGSFRVVRAFGDSVYFDNPNAVEELVTVSDPARDLGLGADSEMDITVEDGMARLTWTGVGTEPDLSVAQRGDVISLAQPDVSAANEGTFMVSQSLPEQRETGRVTTLRGSDLAGGEAFLAHSALDANKYEFWFRVDIGGTLTGSAPGTVGYSPVPIDVLDDDDLAAINAKALATVAAVNGGLDFVVTVVAGKLVVAAAGYAPASPLSGLGLTVQRLLVGRRSGLEYWAPNAVAETFVSASEQDLARTPALGFLPYDSAVPGDTFEITGDLLGTEAVGSYEILQVLNRSKILVAGTLPASEGVAIAGEDDETFVLEQAPYVGYKVISHVALSPGGPTTTTLLVADSTRQASKIGEAGVVAVSAVGKMGFSTAARFGLDSYRYHTGAIAEANRIVYGDPRDRLSYFGIAAAGSEIFIETPDPRRVRLSIAVRVTTGAPFTRVQESVRNAAAAVVKAAPIGESIAFSKIISAINGIPGVRAIAISEPEYDENNDLIVVQPGEKARILDVANDVNVSRIT